MMMLSSLNLQLIEILQESRENISKRGQIDWFTELYDLLLLVGVFTIGAAQYSTMRIKHGYLMALIYFTTIMILEGISAFFYNNEILVVIFVIDGLFHGGMLIVFYEMTAELAYPVGESLSLGLLLAIYFGLRNIFLIVNDLLVEPRLENDQELKRERELLTYYNTMFGIFLTVSAVVAYFAWRSKPEYVRYEFDSLQFDEKSSEGDNSDVMIVDQ